MYMPFLPPPSQDGTITKKNSPGRNLHRLINTLSFISAIFKGLVKGLQLKEAVTGECCPALAARQLGAVVMGASMHISLSTLFSPFFLSFVQRRTKQRLASFTRGW
jgi:Na+-transporting NADH:ubiquinone oxidoreductase subunit NqrD